jgi:hypothetical protein
VKRASSCLLILLLSAAALDDVWACATPDPADDVLAAQNNGYLSPPRRAPRDGSRGCNQPLTDAPDTLPGRFSVNASSPATPLPAHPGAPSGPALLYVLMSLQR